jgi:hypothetical protein
MLKSQFHVVLTLCLLTLVACRTPLPGAGGRDKVGAKKDTVQAPAIFYNASSVFGAGGLIPGNNGSSLISNNGGSLISNNGGSLNGVAKIPDALVSNNSGSLISNGAAGIIANNSGGLISNNGGSLISNNSGSYRLLASLAEKPLDGFLVQIVDASGQVIVDEKGNPYQAKTDSRGFYQFFKTPRGQNLLIKLTLPNQIGEMISFLPDAKPQEIRKSDVNGLSTLNMGYILDQYVKGKQATLQKLPAKVEEDTRQKLATALSDNTAIGSIKPVELVELVSEARSGSTVFDKQMEYVKSLLVAGLDNLGDGLKATSVGLSLPQRVHPLGTEGWLITERYGNRVRLVKRDGTIETFAGRDGKLTLGDGGKALDAWIESPTCALFNGKDAVYISSKTSRSVRRVDLKTGIINTIAGNGENDPQTPGTPTQTGFGSALDLALDHKGRLIIATYFGIYRLDDANTLVRLSKRLNVTALASAPNGKVYGASGDDGLFYEIQESTVLPRTDIPGQQFPDESGLSIGADGTWYLGVNSEVKKIKPGEAAWSVLAGTPKIGKVGGIYSGADYLMLTDYFNSKIYKFSLSTQKSTLVAGLDLDLGIGQGIPADQVPFQRPHQLVFGLGRTLITDILNQRVWERKADGLFYAFAGGGDQTVDNILATEAKLGAAAGIAAKADGSVYIAEVQPGGAGSIKRVSIDRKLTTVKVNGTKLASPVALAFADNGDLLFSNCQPGASFDLEKGKVCRLDSTGNMTELTSEYGLIPTIVSRPEGIYFLEYDKRQPSGGLSSSLRLLKPNGDVEIICGGNEKGFAGDGGAAKDALLDSPTGFAFGANGDIYIADSRNDRIRRIRNGTIVTVAGLDTGILGGVDVADSLKQPAGLAFDLEGNLIISDSGHNQIKMIRADQLSIIP